MTLSHLCNIRIRRRGAGARMGSFLAILLLLFMPLPPGSQGLFSTTAHAADDATAKPATEWKTTAGPFDVLVQRATWTDAKRQRDVPVTIYLPDGGGPWPVIIFSHGLGGSRDGYSFLGKHWASHGFVCVHPQHIGSDEGVWKDQPKPYLALQKAVANLENSINRPLDVSFVIDELTRRNGLPDDPLRGKLDLVHLGVGGHSFGAFTTLAVAGEQYAANVTGGEGRSFRDPRVVAALPMSSPVVAKGGYDLAYAQITIPCLHMTGTVDDSPIGDTTAEQRRIPFDFSVNAPRFLVTFRNGDHMVFSGTPRLRAADRALDARLQPLILQASTAFWDATLKNDAAALTWLRDGGFVGQLGDNGTFEVKSRAPKTVSAGGNKAKP